MKKAHPCVFLQCCKRQQHNQLWSNTQIYQGPIYWEHRNSFQCHRLQNSYNPWSNNEAQKRHGKLSGTHIRHTNIAKEVNTLKRTIVLTLPRWGRRYFIENQGTEKAIQTISYNMIRMGKIKHWHQQWLSHYALYPRNEGGSCSPAIWVTDKKLLII